jgi:acylphosphatase
MITQQQTNTIAMNDIKKRIIIQGQKVHDVGYRVFLLNLALKNGLEGFSAFNQISPDKIQQIEISIMGDINATDDFIADIREKIPTHAIVNDITIEPYNRRVVHIQDYMHLVQVEQLDKGIPAILSIKSSQEQMLVKQDQMLNKQDQMLDKQDKMILLQMETVDEVKGFRKDSGTYFEIEFSEIKRKLHSIENALNEMGIKV